MLAQGMPHQAPRQTFHAPVGDLLGEVSRPEQAPQEPAAQTVAAGPSGIILLALLQALEVNETGFRLDAAAADRARNAEEANISAEEEFGSDARPNARRHQRVLWQKSRAYRTSFS